MSDDGKVIRLDAHRPPPVIRARRDLSYKILNDPETGQPMIFIPAADEEDKGFKGWALEAAEARELAQGLIEFAEEIDQGLHNRDKP